MSSVPGYEFAPYLTENPVLPAGSAGKRGYLRMVFEMDGEGRSVLRDLERRTPLIVQQELYFDEQMPQMPCVYILSSGGPNVDGDRYEQNITVRRGACAHVSTGAATKLAEMHHDCSIMTQRFTLEDDAYLEYLPEPTIPCRHTRYACDTSIEVSPSATLFYSEIYTCGRRYYGDERFVYDVLSLSVRGSRPGGDELFREKMVIRPYENSPLSVGAMNGYDVFANVVVLTPESIAETVYASTEPFIDRDRGVAAGITRLPSACGLSFRVLGRDTEPVKMVVREFCSAVRMAVKGRPLFDEFPWR